jgi:TRAP transporter TAXI family solute receptor
MTMTLKGLLRTVALVTLVAAPAQAEDTFIRVGGGLAGTYPIFAAKLTQLMNDNISDVRASVVPGDTEPMQIQMQQGEVEFNIAYSWITKKISDGKGGLGIATPKARHVVTLYGSALQVLAKPGTITSLDQIDDDRYRVYTGPEGFFFDQIVTPALEAHDVTKESIKKAGGVLETMGYGSQLQAFQDGKLDAAFFTGGVPLGMLQQIENSPGFNLVPFSPESIDKMAEILPGIGSEVIPAGTYKGQDEDVLSVWHVNHLVTSEDVPDEIVYQVTKLMNEKYAEFHGLFPGSEEIDNIDPFAGNELPLHAGAERYYREIGEIN